VRQATVPGAFYPIQATILDDIKPAAHIGYDAKPDTAFEFLRGLNELSSVPPCDTTNGSYKRFPTILGLASLVSSTSRAVLRFTRRFM
jgi:hypothetical protein